MLLVASLTLVAAGCAGEDDVAVEQVITVNWGTEPRSLDPSVESDSASARILLNIMDPLVKLDENLNAVPNAAERIETGRGGLSVTFILRDDLRWTNGDPVTAGDFEYSWKRAISRELGGGYAYQFAGIAGAAEYAACDPQKEDCDVLRDQVGVEAVDERTLEVTLAARQPWFVQQVAHHAFLAVHRPTVERFGEEWTEAANIVTNGPFKLERWQHGSAIDLVRDPGWRDADNVELERVRGRMISNGRMSVEAFEAGELDVTSVLPAAAILRLKERPEYERYPGLATYYYAVNVENIPDVEQRRAMALAIPRRSIVDEVARGDQLPATGFTPKGMPGYDAINPEAELLPVEGELERAKELMREAARPKTDITLYINDAEGHREIAVAIRAAWEELGIESTIKEHEFGRYLEFLGPPPNPDIDVYRLGWIGDFVDAFNFLELWTCESVNNSTNYCNEEYDALLEEARETESDEGRFDLYAQAEEILFGEDGDMPVLPIYFFAYPHLEQASVRDTFDVNPFDQIDLTKVVVAG